MTFIKNIEHAILLSSLLNQMIELAQATLNPHHSQNLRRMQKILRTSPTREGKALAKDMERIRTRWRVRGEGAEEEKETHREAERREGGGGGEGEDRRGLGERCGPAAGPSRMTIISGHWVHGAWRLSFAPYSYACPSCLSKPSLF